MHILNIIILPLILVYILILYYALNSTSNGGLILNSNISCRNNQE